MSTSVVQLKDYCSLITKGTTPTSVGYEFSDDGVGFLRVQNISGGNVNFQTETLFIEESVHQELRRSQILPGDILLSIAGTIGRTAVVPADAPALNCNQALAIIRTTDKVFRPFLRHWLESANAQSQMRGATVTGTIQNLSLAQVGGLQVPLPPISEQRRIAAILDQADALRTKRREALRGLGSLTESIFVEMYGKPEQGFRGISLVQLRDVTTRITDGTHLTPKFISSGVPFIFVKNFHDGQVNFETDKFISEEEHISLYKRCPVEKGDVLYTTVGATYGQAAMVGEFTKFAFQRHVAHLKPDVKKILPDFLGEVMKLSLVKRQADRWARGAAQPTLNLTELRQFEIPLPSLERQLDFVNRTWAIAKLKKAMAASSSKLDILFASLQSRAFLGEL